MCIKILLDPTFSITEEELSNFHDILPEVGDTVCMYYPDSSKSGGPGRVCKIVCIAKGKTSEPCGSEELIYAGPFEEEMVKDEKSKKPDPLHRFDCPKCRTAGTFQVYDNVRMRYHFKIVKAAEEGLQRKTANG